MITRSVDPNGDIRYHNAQGQLHRTDGPTIIYADGSLHWYLEGFQYTFDEWLKRAGLTEEQKTLLYLQYHKNQQ